MGDGISGENVKGPHLAAKRIEIMAWLCDSDFSWFVPAFVCVNLSEDVHPLINTQSRTDVSNVGYFSRISYISLNNDYITCKEREIKKWDKNNPHQQVPFIF